MEGVVWPSVKRALKILRVAKVLNVHLRSTMRALTVTEISLHVTREVAVMATRFPCKAPELMAYHSLHRTKL